MFASRWRKRVDTVVGWAPYTHPATGISELTFLEEIADHRAAFRTGEFEPRLEIAIEIIRVREAMAPWGDQHIAKCVVIANPDEILIQGARIFARLGLSAALPEFPNGDRVRPIVNGIEQHGDLHEDRWIRGDSASQYKPIVSRVDIGRITESAPRVARTLCRGSGSMPRGDERAQPSDMRPV